MMENDAFISVVKIIVFSSVLFVWVIRYQNIVEEFKFFNYPNWLRDLVGILKISFVVMIMNSDAFLVRCGSTGIALLMLAALATHFKVKNPSQKMLPSLTLLILSLLIMKSAS